MSIAGTRTVAVASSKPETFGRFGVEVPGGTARERLDGHLRRAPARAQRAQSGFGIVE